MTANLPLLPADDGVIALIRSSNIATCEVPRTHTSLGDRSFTLAGPRLWNDLPLIYVTLNILSRSFAGYGRRTCFAEDSGA